MTRMAPGLPVDAWLDDPAQIDERLRRALTLPLPGLAAQTIMAPKPRAGWRPASVPADARHAAALILLYPEAPAGGVRLALTVRAPDLYRHGGQVSLPGGAVEPGETDEDAALREAHEEIGLDPASVRILGRLTPLHIPVSGFRLLPVLGSAAGRPAFRLDGREVARLLEVPMARLASPECVRLRLRTHEGRHYEVPYFAIDGEQVWGATAMILAELLAMLGVPPVLPGVTGRAEGGTP